MLTETFRKLSAPSEVPDSTVLPTVDEEDARHVAATKVAAAAKGRKARAEQAERKEAAVKLQSINRGKQARKGGAAKGGWSSGSASIYRALSNLYERCDETELGVSASELEEKLSADAELKALLEAEGVGRYEKLLHELELGKWLATEGSVSYAALMKIVMTLPTGGAASGAGGDVSC